jgi:hypothetical protein
MATLLEKLNYKGNDRIAVLNAEESFMSVLSEGLNGVTVDKDIDARFPYHFIFIFVKNLAEAENFIPIALHNLSCDGVLWFGYPKKSSRKYSSDIDRDHGWKSLNDAGFYGIRLISIDDDWSALRFRSIRFIKSSSGRIPK